MANLIRGKQIGTGSNGIKAVNVDTTEVPTLAAANTFTGANTVSVAGSLTIAGTLTVSGGSSSITVPTPTTGSQAANKTYVDSVASGLQWKASARTATTAAIANLTSVSTTMDGTTLVAGDRVLVMSGASRDGVEAVSHAHDGIYVVGTVTTGTAPFTRSADANTGTPGLAGSLTSGAAIFVTDGTVNGGNGFVLTTDNPITLDTTVLTFVQFTGTGDIVAGAGLSKTGNTLFVSNATAGNILIGQGVSSSTTFNAVSGDATLASSGALTIAAAAVTGGAGGKLAANTVDATNLFKGTAGSLLIGQGASNTAYTAMSGDATISSAGVLTIAAAAVTGSKIASATVTGSNMVNNTVTGTQLFQGTSGSLLIGQGGSNTAYTAMSGDATITNAGVLTVASAAITGAKIAANTITGANIARSTAGNLLIAQGAGADTAYTAMSGDATITSAGVLTVAAASITGAKIASTTVAGSNMVNNTVTGTQLFQGTSGSLLIGQGGSNTAYTAMSGDATITNAGVLTIAAAAVTGSKIASATVTGSNMVNNTVTGTQLFLGTSGALLIGQGASVTAYTAMSGDATITNGGVLTIAANAITSGKIATSAVGNGLTGGGGSALAVLAQNTSIQVSGSGIKASVPTTGNKSMTASVTSADGDLACATTLAATPGGSEYISVTVNGIEVTVGNAVKTSACYFSGNGGTTSRAYGAAVSGDSLYWVQSVAGYNLDATDTISFLYNV